MQWLGSNTLPNKDLNSLNIYPLSPLLLSLYTYWSCSTNIEEFLLCSTRSVVFSGTDFLHLAGNRQGTIYNLPIYPYMPPVIYRLIFQLAFSFAPDQWDAAITTAKSDSDRIRSRLFPITFLSHSYCKV